MKHPRELHRPKAKNAYFDSVIKMKSQHYEVKFSFRLKCLPSRGVRPRQRVPTSGSGVLPVKEHGSRTLALLSPFPQWCPREVGQVWCLSDTCSRTLSWDWFWWVGCCSTYNCKSGTDALSGYESGPDSLFSLIPDVFSVFWKHR